MADSAIEWTDATWNPVVGCTRASAGCDNCYAVVMTKRLESMGQAKYSGLVNPGKGHFNGVVRTVEDALTIPLGWKKPRRVFVNSMSDLFHKDVPFEFIDKVFAVMALTPHHTYQILTKRPERMAEYLSEGGPLRTRSGYISFAADRITGVFVNRRLAMGWPLPNVWLGTSVEDQQTADERIPHLLKCPAAVRFLSCEPLLGPVDLDGWTGRATTNCPKCGDNGYFTAKDLPRSWTCMQELEDGSDCDGIINVTVELAGIHWVICGGESGPNARPMHPDWARSLRDQCQAAGVPFFFKQWGEWCPEMTSRGPEIGIGIVGVTQSVRNRGLWPPEMTSMYRLGKHRAGRLLDGREWNEFPEVAR